MPKLTDDHRRALELLAGSPNGCTERLRANAFARDLLADLILDRLVLAEMDRMMANGKQVEVRRIRITDAGRRALGR